VRRGYELIARQWLEAQPRNVIQIRLILDGTKIGSWGSGFGPRSCGASPLSSPRSRSRRQLVRWDEYKPFRRSKAPVFPVPWLPSSLRKVRSLYSAVNCWRFALATISVFGIFSFTLPFGSCSMISSSALQH
jgi:hypothetical protein